MNIQERIKQACSEMEEVEYRSYSGRGMYGEQCVGIVGSWGDCMTVISLVISNHVQEMHDAARSALLNSDDVIEELSEKNDGIQTNLNLLFDFRSDQMGRSDVVVYWPDIEYIKLSSDDGDDE